MPAEPSSFNMPALNLPGLCQSVEYSPMPTVEVEEAGHLVRYVNRAFYQLLGQSREELLGKPLAQIIPQGDECLAVLERVYQTGESETHSHPVRAKPSPLC